MHTITMRKTAKRSHLFRIGDLDHQLPLSEPPESQLPLSPPESQPPESQLPLSPPESQLPESQLLLSDPPPDPESHQLPESLLELLLNHDESLEPDEPESVGPPPRIFAGPVTMNKHNAMMARTYHGNAAPRFLPLFMYTSLVMKMVSDERVSRFGNYVTSITKKTSGFNRDFGKSLF
jgi:hypothetical protein